MADESRAQALIKRFREQKGRRAYYDSHWDDLARVMLPQRLGFTSPVADGAHRVDNLYDGTPMQAARGLANAVASYVRPEGDPWFFLKAKDARVGDDPMAKAWLSDSEERLRAAFDDPKARFRQACGECDLDLVVLGTGIIFVGDALKRLSFQSVHLKDAVVIFGEEGDAQGVLRERSFSLRQLERKFGADALSARLRDTLKQDRMDEKVAVLHAVVPREEGRVGALLARNLPYADLWIEMDGAHEIKVGGFHEFPFVVPRWDTSSGEDYGRSPGMIALPDANTLQAMGETILIAGQRAADPPLAVPSDSAYNAYNTVPGGLAYYDAELAQQIGRIPIAPLENGTNLPITRDMQQDMRGQVMAAFLKNILNLPAPGPQMTATEITARKEEFIREIGPVFGRLETDYTAPMVERAFKILLRTPNALLPIPPVLQGRAVCFEYQSPVTKIRQQVTAAAAQAWITQMAALAQAGHPEAMDLVDLDAYARFAHDSANLPADLQRDAKAVAQLRAGRASAQQRATQMNVVQQLAEIAHKGAGAAQIIANGARPTAQQTGLVQQAQNTRAS